MKEVRENACALSHDDNHQSNKVSVVAPLGVKSGPQSTCPRISTSDVFENATQGDNEGHEEISHIQFTQRNELLL